MAIVHFVNYKKPQTVGGMLYVLRYTMQDKKTVADDGKKYVTGVNCTPQSAYTEFNNTKKLFGKTEGRQYYHFVQSFSVDENISPGTAHEIALRFAEETEKFKGFEVVVSTHCDRDHIHSHFVMNSVNSETGKKFHISEREIEMLMQVSDKICREYGLSVIESKPKNERAKPMSDREYRSAVKGESWKIQLEAVISNAMQTAASKEHFIMLMEAEGYGVKWTDSRKNITYTTPDGKLCRDSKLHLQKFLKENMEYEFKIRQEICRRINFTGTETADRGGYRNPLRVGDRDELEVFDFGAEFSDRDIKFNHRDFADPYDQGGNDGLYESPVDGVDRIHQADQSGDRGVSGFDDEGGGEYVGVNSTDPYRDRETGWESERGFFEQALFGGGQNAGAYEQNVLGVPGTFGDTLDIGIGAAYLVGNLGNIIDEETPVEDCTTKYYPAERKKNHGPVMGGM
ncbi:MAG: relaxase/mobilization nuclease domain-containing protein [Acutalibacteraceae bacterium]